MVVLKTIWRFMIVYHLMLSGNFWWLGNSTLDFLGVKFWSRDFFVFWFLPPFNHPCHLKSGVPQTCKLNRRLSHVYLRYQSCYSYGYWSTEDRPLGKTYQYPASDLFNFLFFLTTFISFLSKFSFHCNSVYAIVKSVFIYLEFAVFL